ncbi:Rhodanese-like domain-containing protein [Blastocladiella britannica]|nr:Rhodanese-like domain-containing protein [Blastocladiella britannica]
MRPSLTSALSSLTRTFPRSAVALRRSLPTLAAAAAATASLALLTSSGGPARLLFSSSAPVDLSTLVVPSPAVVDAAFAAGIPIGGADLAALVRSGATGVGKDILVIDVRSPGETSSTGVIPTAVTLPLSEFGAQLAEPSMQFQLLNGFPKPSRESTNIVVYCQAGVRAQKAADIARSLGYKRVRNYQGSWGEWSSKYAAVQPGDVESSGSGAPAAAAAAKSD